MFNLVHCVTLFFSQICIYFDKISLLAVILIQIIHCYKIIYKAQAPRVIIMDINWIYFILLDIHSKKKPIKYKVCVLFILIPSMKTWQR